MEMNNNDVAAEVQRYVMLRRQIAEKAIRVTRIESLPENLKDELLQYGGNETLEKLADRLRKRGYLAGRSTIGRFIRKHRMKDAVEERQQLVEMAKEMAGGADAEALRAGSLGALRQKIFDRSVSSGDANEGLKMYAALTAEEATLRRLALDEERARMQREALDLQRQRLQIEAARGCGKLFLEALRILKDERLEDRAKVARVMERLENWKAGAIDVKEAPQLEDRKVGVPLGVVAEAETAAMAQG